MKSLKIILFASCGFFVTIKCIEDVKCPKSIDQNEIILLPSNKNCSSFIQCLPYGSQTTFLCPSGLHFNSETKQCDCSTNAKCDKVIKYPTEDTLLPNAADCTTYIQCSNGVPLVMPCLTGLYFNRETKQCDYPESANCNPVSRIYKDDEEQENYNEDTISKSISNDIKCPDDKSIPHFIPGPKCNKYFRCANGIAVEWECPPGLIFNPNINECEWLDNYPCEDDN